MAGSLDRARAFAPLFMAWLVLTPQTVSAQEGPDAGTPDAAPPDAAAPDAAAPDAAAPDAAAPDAAAPDAAPPDAAPPDAAPPDAAPPVAAPALTPPHIVRSSPPEYPPGRLAAGLHPSVVLVVTLDAAGHVVEAEVEHGADAEFDGAARAAVRSWTFAPAQRGQTPIPSRIRVAVHFALPSFDLATPAEAETPVVLAPHGHHGIDDASPEHDTHHEEASEPDGSGSGEREPEIGVTATVEHEARTEDRGAGSFEIERDILEAAPRQEGADLLLSVPGVFAARAEGMAVGHRINLRGFDADHGQDIELRVGGLPINQPSHIHGQGYADLGFVIPDVVRRVRATEGVYDPRQGDFAVAGSIEFDLGVPDEHRGFRASSGYGLFNTFRQLVMWAPEGEREATFGAVQYRHSDGYGARRGGDTLSAIVQAAVRSGDWRLRGLAILHGARADVAGVLRVDDVEAGRVGYYDAYAHPTAQNQSALAGRFLGGLFADYRGERGSNGSLGVWLGGDFFRLQENFTGFIQRSRALPGVSGRGDLIEQRNETLSAGLTGRYRTPRYEPWEWLSGHLEAGLDGRFDQIEQAQNLIATRNQTWDQRVDASINSAQIGFFGDLELHVTEYLRLNVGVRTALQLYEVDDRLGNLAEAVRPDDTFLVGHRRSAAGVTAGPRASAEVRPLEWLSLRAAYGHGYRSPQARTLDDGESAPFTEVRSADLGAVVRLDRLLRVSVAGYWTELSDDVAFEPREGRLERIGASRRLGAVLYVQARPVDWFVGALSVTYVDAELLEGPPASAGDPQPAFEAGQNLPYVPPVVIRADVGVHGTLAPDVLGQRLHGRLGLGYSFLSPRPLPFGGSADPVHLVDAGGSIGLGPVELGVALFNLFDMRYAASEFLFSSNWDPDAVPSRVPARHRSAGSPFTLMVTLGVSS